MAVKGGPDIITEGLVFHLDAAGAISGKGYDPEGLRVEYLIVGGGGGSAPAYSAHASSGGGGAGAFRTGYVSRAGSTYTVVVGGGGPRTTTTICGRGSVGGDSSVFSITSNGGAGAGTWCSSGGYMSGTSNGNASGSGSGGAGITTTNSGGSGGEFGNDGGSHTGTGQSNGSTSCGGGGGAGGPGGNGVANQLGGDGGIGKSSNITGNGTFYAGGGAGGSTKGINNNGGGRGGGGNRGNPPNNTTGGSNPGQNGTANTGGGGGGASGGTTTAYGGNGGSGIVMIRYRGKQKATGGDTIVYKNGYTIHTFTSSGSFVLDESVDGLSTNKIVGTLTNMDSSNFNSGNGGYFGFNLDGTNEYIDLPTINVSTTANTVCAWARKANTDGGFHNIYTPWSNGFDNWLGAYTNKWFLFVTQSADTGNVFLYSNSTITANIWYFVCSTIDVNVAKIYVNGELNFTASLGFTIGSWNAAATIGRRATISNYYWEGNIASISVYNHALPQDKISDLYNATKGRYGL